MREKPKLPPRRRANSILMLEGASPTFEGRSIEISPSFSVNKIDQGFVENLRKAGVRNIDSLVGECKVCIQICGTDSTEDLMRPTAFQSALLLSGDVRAQEKSHIIMEIGEKGEGRNITATELPARGTVVWGHHRAELNIEDVESAKRLLPSVEVLQGQEKFSRVGNALLFYRNGCNSDNPDLALMAFATCLESLFSTAEQELSFRLSLRVASFLADKNTERQELFEECKEVYKIRSKVVHGAAIFRDSEQAAIYLVDSILPQAERLARRSLAKVLEMKLEPLFENAARLNSLFDRLLFSDSLVRALGEIQGKK